MNTIRKYGFQIALFVLVALMAAYLLYTYGGGRAEKLPVVSEVADFTLTNLDGAPYTFSESNGKVRLVYFYFAYCPEECPITTSYAAEVQDKLKREQEGSFGRDYEFVWISIDPERDTPEIVERFAQAYRADLTGWRFLNGEAEEIVKIANDSFNLGVRNNAGPEGLIHMDIPVIVDKEGRIRKHILMNRDETPSPDEVAEMMKRLQKE